NAVSDGQPILIGDSARFTPPAAGQYNLGDEPGDIQATTVVINAIGSGENAAPDIQVLDVRIDGSQSSDEGGSVANVTLNTAGSVLVEGNVGFRNPGSADT